MSKYAIQDTSLNNIANGINAVTGETSKISPAGMQTKLGTIESAVDAQASLIDQIESVLNGKIGGGGIVAEPLSVTANGTYTAPPGKAYSPVTVNVPGIPTTIAAGDTPVVMNTSVNRRAGTSYGSISGTSITIKKAGTYRFKWLMFRSATSGTFGTRLYKGTTAQGTAKTTFSNNSGVCTEDLACAAGDVISIYGRSGSTSNYIYAGQLTACIDWNTGF